MKSKNNVKKGWTNQLTVNGKTETIVLEICHVRGSGQRHLLATNWNSFFGEQMQIRLAIVAILGVSSSFFVCYQSERSPAIISGDQSGLWIVGNQPHYHFLPSIGSNPHHTSIIAIFDIKNPSICNKFIIFLMMVSSLTTQTHNDRVKSYIITNYHMWKMR